ncbi:hypothetical protein ES705_20340 [subsurface metagenome]
MEEARNIKIIIKSVDNRKGEHIAYYKSDLMQATFSVYIKDSIFGALALHRFTEMICKTFGKNYKTDRVDFVFSDDLMHFENKAVLDVVAGVKAFCA